MTLTDATAAAIPLAIIAAAAITPIFSPPFHCRHYFIISADYFRCHCRHVFFAIAAFSRQAFITPAGDILPPYFRVAPPLLMPFSGADSRLQPLRAASADCPPPFTPAAISAIDYTPQLITLSPQLLPLAIFHFSFQFSPQLSLSFSSLISAAIFI
jgi:hypothetical protein